MKISIKLRCETIEFSEWQDASSRHLLDRHFTNRPSDRIRDIYKFKYNGGVAISLNSYEKKLYPLFPLKKDLQALDSSKLYWYIEFYDYLYKFNSLYSSINNVNFQLNQLKEAQNQVDKFLLNFNIYSSFL